MKAWDVLPLFVALSLFGCETAPPEPERIAPKIDELNRNVAADIAELNGELLACMRRENDRLREDKAQVEAKIRAALVEAEAIQNAAERKGKQQR